MEIVEMIANKVIPQHLHIPDVFRAFGSWSSKSAPCTQICFPADKSNICNYDADLILQVHESQRFSGVFLEKAGGCYELLKTVLIDELSHLACLPYSKLAKNVWKLLQSLLLLSLLLHVTEAQKN